VQPPQIETPDIDVRLEPYFPERLPDWGRDAMHSAERLIRENGQVRQMMMQIRYRLREEARRQMIAERRARSREIDLIDSP
jgi:hypothetical protein